MLLGELMCSGVEQVGPQVSVAQAAERMRQTPCGYLLVVNDQDAILGILTDHDIRVRAVNLNLNLEETAVEDVMTPGAVTGYEDQDAAVGLRLLESTQIRRLIVLDDGDRPVGVVTLEALTAVIEPPQ